MLARRAHKRTEKGTVPRELCTTKPTQWEYTPPHGSKLVPLRPRRPSPAPLLSVALLRLDEPIINTAQRDELVVAALLHDDPALDDGDDVAVLDG
eukprot:1754292-Prymnesium_polylepis.1